MTKFTPAPVSSVRLTGGLLADRQRAVINRSIDQQYQQCKTTGRLGALGLPWKPGSADVPKPHQFWDSDVAKWIESSAYAVMLQPDADLEQKLDDAIADMARSQRADGYFNSFFLAAEPEKIFTNLREMHELYCAGHMIEAAVAYFQATGKRTMLDVMTRYADYIGKVFGPAAGQKHGYDGHEEIELALVKLYRVTQNPAHINLAKHFIDARGQSPHFFDEEAVARGQQPDNRSLTEKYDHYQAHAPIREQKTIEGHSVRALYMLSGAIDVAYETSDKQLIAAAKRLFDNCVNRRMYITGGVGSTRHGERFTYDFDLPNESAYAETCANIALIFAAARLLNHDRDSRYADIIERALYNAVLPGLSLDGTLYFYANRLATDPQWNKFERSYPTDRQGWFSCACCPPNVARLLTSLGGYMYSTAPGAITVHLYGSSTITHENIRLTQQTNYPWDGGISFTISGGQTKLSLRLPAWCEKPALKHNGKTARRDLRKLASKGYLTLNVADGDRIELDLPMPPVRVYSDVRVRHNAGRVALSRGPLIYCIEQKDNGADLAALSLSPKAKLTAKFEKSLLGGVVTISAPAQRDTNSDKALYTTRRPLRKPAKLKAVPYYAWNNRGTGEMAVWIRES